MSEQLRGKQIFIIDSFESMISYFFVGFINKCAAA